MADKQPLFTIQQLAAGVAAALSPADETGLSGRVRPIPDVRTLRYYTTLGLLDRPTRLEGRTGYYGRRHLWQLVSIKRLQAQGLSLADIQARLLGASDDELASLAQLPADFSVPTLESPRSNQPAAESATSPEPDRVFWKALPPVAAGPAAAPSAAPAEMPRAFAGISLAPDLSLLLQSARPLDEQDLAAIQAATGPLLEVLRGRGLLF